MMYIQLRDYCSNVKSKKLMQNSLFFVFFLIMLFPKVVCSDWTTNCIDCPRWFHDFYSRSIDLDIVDNPHIVYGGDRLYYAYYNGTTWIYETVDSSQSVGEYASIAVDSNNKVHISYYEITNNNLKYATNKSGSWNIQVVNSTGDVGSYSSLAIDSNDYIHISYFDATNENLMYSTNLSDSWTTSIVDSVGSVGQHSSIAVDSADYIHISYYDDTNRDLKYATNNVGTWATETVDSAPFVGQYTSIAIDSNNFAHISYYIYDNGFVYARDLKYATNTSGNWIASTAASTGYVGKYTSIALDSNNKVYISYFDEGFSEYSISYTTNASGVWEVFPIDVVGPYVIAYSSIAIDSNNKVHIGYFSNQDIKYTTNRSGGWEEHIVDSAQSVGKHNSISLDSNDRIHVSYSDNNTQEIKYATNTSDDWVISTLYSYGRGYSPFISLATDSLNTAHISFNRRETIPNRGSLNYATDETGDWNWYLMEEENCPAPAGFQVWTCNTGIGSSVAIDTENYAHISFGYYSNYHWCDVTGTICIDDTQYALKYATNASGGWSINTITTDKYIGNTCLAIGSDGTLHVSYYNVYTNRIGHVYKYEQLGWLGGDLPVICKSPSLAVDYYSNAHIACSTYNQYTNDGKLQYVDLDGRMWSSNSTVVVVDASVDVGEHVSLAIDSNDKLHISYYDLSNKDLRYATNVSGTWITSVIDSRGDVGLFNSVAVDSEDNVYISYYDASNHDLKYATNADIIYPPPCTCDFTPADGDVDGADLVDYISDSAGISLNEFATEFGRINCP